MTMDDLDAPSLATSQEQRIAHLEARLRESEERLARQEEFFQMAVHDLRSPLSAIVVYAELLMNKVMGDLEDRQLEPIRTIHRNCTQLIRMAEDVLASARMQSGALGMNTTTVSLFACAQDAVTQLEGLAHAKNVRINLSPAQGNCIREGDSDLLTRAFANILGNAIKFSPHGGEICISVQADDKEVRISVTDEGPGISPEKRKAIFDKFRRGDCGTQGGHGLGLAIAKFFIELHGGRILVEGVRSRGSTFLIGLPFS